LPITHLFRPAGKKKERAKGNVASRETAAITGKNGKGAFLTPFDGNTMGKLQPEEDSESRP